MLTLRGVGDTEPWFRANAVLGVAITPDGRFALGGRIDGVARVWSVLSGEEICRFEGHAGWWGFRGITDVAWLPDGERALSCCEDGTLCLWHARTGKELKRWDHRRGIRRLALSGDGKVAVTGAWEGSLRVWYLD
jgi:WD40 repeat protein